MNRYDDEYDIDAPSPFADLTVPDDDPFDMVAGLWGDDISERGNGTGTEPFGFSDGADGASDLASSGQIDEDLWGVASNANDSVVADNAGADPFGGVGENLAGGEITDPFDIGLDSLYSDGGSIFGEFDAVESAIENEAPFGFPPDSVPLFEDDAVGFVGEIGLIDSDEQIADSSSKKRGRKDKTSRRSKKTKGKTSSSPVVSEYLQEVERNNRAKKVKVALGYDDLVAKSGGKAGSIMLARVENVPRSPKAKDKFRKIRRARVIYENDISPIDRRFLPSRIFEGILALFALGMISVGTFMGVQYFFETSTAQAEFQEVIDEYVVEDPIAVEEQGGAEFDSSSWPPIIDFASLQATNPDVTGWIRIPGTAVDYPVMSSPEQDFYLHHDMRGNYSSSGAIFADFENSRNLNEDNHIVIYGHHMTTKTMFHDVASYVDPSFFDSHRIMYLETPETTYVLKAVAMYNVPPEEYSTRTVLFNNSQQFQTYLDERVIGRSNHILYDDWNRETTDKFVTLITCNNTGSERQIVECIVEQQYPTSMIPNVIDRALGEFEASQH